jgi:hypothetical protein
MTEDHSILFANRHLGIGPFSMSPSDPGCEEDVGRLADFAVYEETESMHAPADRAAMTALSTNCALIPRDCNGIYRVVDHLDIQLTILFTGQCPPVTHIHDLVQLLRDGSRVGHYLPHDFTVLMWSLHNGCREFFLEQKTLSIQRLLVDRTFGFRYPGNAPAQAAENCPGRAVCE